MWTNNKPKSKYAAVMVADWGYRYGANQIINAMDYYGNKIDLHFIHLNLPDDYLKQLKEADLNYRLALIEYSSLLKEYRKEYPEKKWDLYHDACWIRHWYRQKIQDDYSVIGILETDNILVNDITPWFELTEGTNKMLTAYHIYQSIELENYTDEHHETIIPLYIQPAICDQKKWNDVYDMMLKDREHRRECDMLSYGLAIKRCKRDKDVVVLPDCQWIGGWIWTAPISKLDLLDGKSYIVTNPSMIRVNTLHGKWHCEGFRKNQIETSNPEHKAILTKNLEIVVEFYKMFNETMKVKIPRGDLPIKQ